MSATPIRSSKRKKPALTRAEIQAAYRRRQAQEKRTELRELVAIAYELGRKSRTAAPIAPSRLLTELRAIREARAAAGKSSRAARYLALIGLEQPAATIPEIRAALTPATDEELREGVTALLATANNTGAKQ
jgi:hypothetical protein